LLRETREEKGITFDEVSKTLFVRKRVVGAIEAGDWGSLPHPVYVKGYVTQYAIFLSILDLIKSEITSRGNLPPLGPESVSKRKKGILRRWQFRKRGTQISQPVAAPWSVIDQL
jgi:cytoskeleton protein RodZ